MGYFQTTAKGVSWLAVLRGLIRGFTFLRLFFLARILSPTQFGTFGVATLVLAFIEVLTETGVNIVLVQEDKKNFSTYLNSAWVVSIIRGIIISSGIALTAPMVANFFHNPESITLLYLIALVPLIKGFINPSIVLFQKELQFDKEVLFRGVIVSSGTVITIILAFVTRSPISLAIGMISEAIIEVVLSFIFLQSKPSLSFSKVHFLHIFNRGKWITIAGIFNYLYQQLDDIVVGRKLDTTNLGFYQMAYRLSMLPITEVADVFNRVTFPVYQKLIEDPNRIKKAFLKTAGFISLISVVFASLLIFIPEFIVELALGKQWLPIVPLLPILGLTGAVRGLSVSAFSLFLAIKKQEYVTYSTLASIIVLAVLIIPLTSMYGLAGAAWASLIGSIAALPVVYALVWKVLKTIRHEASVKV